VRRETKVLGIKLGLVPSVGMEGILPLRGGENNTTVPVGRTKGGRGGEKKEKQRDIKIGQMKGGGKKQILLESSRRNAMFKEERPTGEALIPQKSDDCLP